MSRWPFGCALIVFISGMLFAMPTAQAQTIWYVDQDAAPGGDGTSWATAFDDLQDALDVDQAGDQIWVAAGTYYPSWRAHSSEPLSVTFRLLDGVSTYGGFAGGETSLEQRNPAVNVTTLNGSVGGANCWHVVMATGSPVLDGFRIINGDAELEAWEQDGGGMYAGGSPIVRNCLFMNNHAWHWGGGFYCSDGSPTLVNCLFINNSVQYLGGGAYCCAGSIVTNCTFSGNSAWGPWGNAVYASSSATLTNCILWANGSSEHEQIEGTPIINYSCVQGWTGDLGGVGNMGSNPSFVDGYHLASGSPCVDAGDNSALPADSDDLDDDGDTTEPIPFDLDGMPRFVDDPDVDDTGYGTPPIVDMGAYEYLPAAPLIIDQPESQAVCEGGTVTFIVTAIGEPILEYQWYVDGIPIDGATENSYTIDVAVQDDAGEYHVVVSNSHGSATSNPATLTVVAEGPGISEHPQDQVVCVGDQVTFSVAATGPEPLTYQWYKDGQPIDGATESSYTIDSANPSDAGGYHVVVTNPCDFAASDPATLTVVTDEPSILQQPQSHSVCRGDSVTFSVTAAGPEPLSYQWRKDGEPIDGATETSYVISSAEQRSAGSYDVVVTNPCGSITSDPAMLTVSVGPTLLQHPQGQTICVGSPATFSVVAEGSEPITYQWHKDGQPVGGATEATYTIDPVEADSAGNYSVVVGDACGFAISLPATLTVIDSGPSILEHPQSATVCEGNSVTFSVAAAGPDPLSYQWYKDGQPIEGATEAYYTIDSADPDVDPGSYEAVVTNPCGSITSDPAVLTVNVGPSILEHPDAPPVCAGDSVTFSVTADGSEPLSYQWIKDDDQIILGATESSYTIDPVDLADVGSYKVLVANPCGQVTSASAVLIVVPDEPSVLAHPQSQSICEGDSVTFNVEATPPEVLSYQWRKDAVDIPGAIGDSYTIASVDPSDAGSYDVVLTNSCGSITSDPAVLTVNIGPSILQHPQSQAVCECESVTFSVVASGTETLYYQWRKDGADIPGATGSTHTIDSLEPDDEGSYDAVVTNMCGTVTSDAATLAVRRHPSISQHPQSQSVCEQAAVTFSVVASGWEPVSYQWRKDGVDIPNATSETYTIDSLELGDAGQYDVIVANECASVTSAPATLSIDPVPRIIQQPVSVTIAWYQTHVFCVAASGTALSYQWRRDGIDIESATGECYEATEAGGYTCVVSNACGSATTDVATLTIAPKLQLAASASPAAIKVGGASTLTAAASGGVSPYSYCWDTGQTEASIAVSPTQNRVYTATATDSLGQTATATISVTVVSPMTVAIRAAAYTIAPGESSTLTAAVWGGLRPFDYTWNTGQTGASITVSPIATTTYSVTVTDALAQSAGASATVMITETTEPPTEPPADQAEPDGSSQPDEGEGVQPDSGDASDQADETEPAAAAPPTPTSGLCPAAGLGATALTLLGLYRARSTRKHERR
jgi:hypothetical protein